MPKVTFSKGLTVHTFRPPPTGFDPLTADDARLLRYGYPLRPTDRHLRERWQSVLESQPQVIQPIFHLIDDEVGDQATELDLFEVSPPQSSNFRGGAFVDAPEASELRWIESTWTVPNLRLPLNAGNDEAYSTDAYLTLSENTAGRSTLSCGYGAYSQLLNQEVRTSFRPFWRWEPRGRVGISNLPVNPGDILSIVVCLEVDSRVRARIYCHNWSTRTIATFLVEAPQGHELAATRAGWFIRPNVIDFSGPTSARFGNMYFDGCNAGTTDGRYLNPTTAMHMTDFHGGHPVANVSLLNDTLFRITYVGP